jgi:hypothetical protein
MASTATSLDRSVKSIGDALTHMESAFTLRKTSSVWTREELAEFSKALKALSKGLRQLVSQLN